MLPESAATRLLKHACMFHGLAHPGVPQICDFGIAPEGPWIAYEWIEGVPVADLVADRRLALTEILALLRHAAGLLAFAHLNGVIHHNVTSASLLWCAGDRFPVRIVGWELARFIEQSGNDAAADTYALGEVMRELLVAGDPTIEEHRSALDGFRALAAWVDRLLAPEPDERPTCIETFEEAVRIEQQLDEGIREGLQVEDLELQAELTEWSPPPVSAWSSDRSTPAPRCATASSSEALAPSDSRPENAETGSGPPYAEGQ